MKYGATHLIPGALVAAFGFSGCASLSDKTVAGLTWLQRSGSGLPTSKIEIDGGRIAFSDSGAHHRHHGAPIIFIHGFTGNRDTWNSVARQFRNSHRLVTIDVAGHGQSGKAADGKYDIKSQARRVGKLVARLGIERHHIIGHSMGGAIAGQYTISNPGKVVSLGLVSSIGLKDLHPPEFSQLLKDDKNPLIVTAGWDSADKLKYISKHPPGGRLYILVKGAIDREQMRNEKLYREIFESVNWFEFPAADLASVRVPVCIIWGKSDRVLKPDTAGRFESHLTGTEPKTTFLEDTGHLIIMERPREVAEIYRAFLGSFE